MFGFLQLLAVSSLLLALAVPAASQCEWTMHIGAQKMLHPCIWLSGADGSAPDKQVLHTVTAVVKVAVSCLQHHTARMSQHSTVLLLPYTKSSLVRSLYLSCGPLPAPQMCN